jgi:tRNA G18 (ribose-2'-O)-methylase SpoU
VHILRLDAIVDLAHQHDISLNGVPMSKLTQLSEKRPHQGVILVASPLEFEHQELLTQEEQK